LKSLAANLEGLGTPLMLLSGKPADLIPRAGQRNRCICSLLEPALRSGTHRPEDAALKAELQSRDDRWQKALPGQLLHEPTRLRTTSGTFYKVYSPFWRAIEGDIEDRPPLDAPASEGLPASRSSDRKNSPTGSCCRPSRIGPADAGGLDTRRRRAPVNAWPNSCRRQAQAATPSVATCQAWTPHRGLSPHLANGEISPAQIIEAMKDADADASSDDRTVFRKEVGWREFSWHLLVNEPELATRESQFQIRRLSLAQ
jgi:deoxyribodipyrimidine photo-lyase